MYLIHIRLIMFWPSKENDKIGKIYYRAYDKERQIE